MTGISQALVFFSLVITRNIIELVEKENGHLVKTRCSFLKHVIETSGKEEKLADYNGPFFDRLHDIFQDIASHEIPVFEGEKE